jgi:antimicrobial peptide system SdpB family protein
MLTAVGRWSRRWSAGLDPWTNVYGFARSLLAISTTLTLVCTPTSSLFRPGSGQLQVPHCAGVRHMGAFCLPGVPQHLELAKWVAVVVLLVVASGWRPRWTGILHWWVSASFMSNALLVDGGDSVVGVLTFLLVPVTLTDGRRWHWTCSEPHAGSETDDVRRFVAGTALFLVRLQMAGIYFHAAVAKLAVAEWTDGTALYYYLGSGIFGADAWLAPVLRPLLLNGTTVTLLTWSVLIAEYLLSAGLVTAKRHRPALLVMGITFHGLIMICQGLVSFSLAMMAGLLLYLRPTERAFDFARLLAALRRAFPSVRRRARANAQLVPDASGATGT